MKPKKRGDNKYSVDYFIKKFTAIPASKWCTGTMEAPDGRKCVLGHCGLTELIIGITPESGALSKLVSGDETNLECLWKINDNGWGHPRSNILKKLREIKKGAA